MLFKINETREKKELKIIDSNGVNWINDLIGNSGAVGDYIKFDEDEEIFLINESDFNWWKEYVNNLSSDLEEEQKLKEKCIENDIDPDVVFKIVNEEFTGINDYEYHHTAYQAAFERIREEYSL